MAEVTVPRFMAYDEGCYECHEPSGVIGFYPTPEEAEQAVDAAGVRQQQHWRGQHTMFVIDLAEPEWSEHGPNAPEVASR
jgi:hypothetical protein